MILIMYFIHILDNENNNVKFDNVDIKVELVVKFDPLFINGVKNIQKPETFSNLKALN